MDNNFKLGSVVLIVDDSPCIIWKLGVIEKFNYGYDNKARSAIVRTNSGRLSRPIIKLYSLELYCIDDKPNEIKDNYNCRVKRSSALDAEQKIRKMFSS